MPKVYYETKNEPAFELEQSDDLIAVRTRSGRSLTRSAGPVAQPISAELDDGVLVVSYPEVGVEVYRVPTGRHAKSVSERKSVLCTSPDVQFAGGVLVDPASKEPVGNRAWSSEDEVLYEKENQFGYFPNVGKAPAEIRMDDNGIAVG